MEHFFYHGDSQQLPLQVTYQIGLVLLSLAVVFFACYAGMNVIVRIRAAKKANESAWLFWLLGGAVTAGSGGWSMHFIGLLALQLPLAVGYSLGLTLLSIVPTIVGFAVALYVHSRPRNSKAVLLAGGTLMGCSFGATHLIGMAAMHGINRQLIMLLDPLRFAAAEIASAVLVTLAMFMSNALMPVKEASPAFWAKAKWALVNGSAIAGMHYSTMAATYFVPGEPIVAAAAEYTLAPAALALCVAFASTLIAALAILMSIVDSRLQQAARAQALSRSHMREAIESIADGFSLYDTEDRLVECNQRYRELMDGGQGVLPGMSFEAIIRAAAETGLILDAAGRVDDWVAERLANHRAPRGQYIENFRDNRWIRVSERRVWNIGTVAVCTDITELKCTEIELSKAMDEAQRARAAAEDNTRAKSAFLAMMSHELRTPMNAIIGYSEMLLEDAEESGAEAIVPDLQKILAAGKHLLSLINGILDLSKIEAGKMEIYLENIELPVLINDIVDTTQPLLSKRANNLVVDCPATLPLIYTDLTKLRQGLLNLLSNAAKFTENGIITLCVAPQTLQETEGVLFRVSDTGIGMDEEQAGRVFDVFTQADISTTRKYGGSGLGLTITKRFCQMLGGSISVSSRLGAGSSFEIWLPMRNEDVLRGAHGQNPAG